MATIFGMVLPPKECDINQNKSVKLFGNILSEIITLRMDELSGLENLYMNFCPVYGKLKLHHIFRRI
ncbi:hypothetical protein AK95_23935 [Paenibacillus sp. LC231]|nr:hypothetical protein AK95_23935 [Paenibacillus sp. LC231]